MEVNQIKYFLALAESLNFTEAAHRSGVSQPSLTKSIQRLEDELGGPVVYRDGKDTRLTPLGRDLQIEFTRIQSLLDGVHDLAQDSVLGKRRRLSIGVATTIAPGAFTAFWAYVLKQLPAVELHFHPLLPGEGEMEVLSGKYELCILTSAPKPDAKLTIQRLFAEPLMLAIQHTHPLASAASVTPEEMAAEPYVDRLHCEFRSQLIRHFMDRNIVMHPRVQSEREDWAQQMVAGGVGVCMVPAYSAIVDGIALRPVNGLDIQRDVTLVAVSGSGNPKEVRQVLGLASAFDWSGALIRH